jgi:TIR domain
MRPLVSSPGQVEGFDVFVSHSSRLEPDHEELIESVVARLERRGHAVFWDRNRLRGGEPLVESIEGAIAQSRLAVMFLTRRAQRSGFVALELDEIQRRVREHFLGILVIKLEPACEVPAGVDPKHVLVAPPPWDARQLADGIELACRRLRIRRSLRS